MSPVRLSQAVSYRKVDHPMTSAPDLRPRAYDPTLNFIERTGQFMLTCTVILFLFLGVMWPEPYQKTLPLVVAHLIGGKPLNVVTGVKLDFHPLFIYLQCCLQDIITLFIFYPLIVAGYRRAVEWRVLGPALATIRETADRHKSKIEPYGIAGLLTFVVFPLWSTGALVGAVVGYLIGMRIWVAFATVIVGTLIASAAWVWLFDQINALSPHVATGIVVSLLTIVLITAVLAQVRRLSKQRKAVQVSQTASDPIEINANETPEQKDEAS